MFLRKSSFVHDEGRQVTKSSSLELDVEQFPGMNIMRRTVQGTTNTVTRSQKHVLLYNTVPDKISIVTNTKTRRTTRGKEKETVMDQTILLDSKTLNEASCKVNKSRQNRARKKSAKKAESKSTASTEYSTAKNATIIENSIDAITNDNVVPMSNEDTEVLQVSSRILRLEAAVATSASPISRNRRFRNVKLRLENFTPESSPITVNLTPHRTIKTLRKSPMNLGSPKSHPDALLGFSKIPRKLPVVVESPDPSKIYVPSSIISTSGKLANSNLFVPDNSKKLQRLSTSLKNSGKSPRHCDSKIVAIRKFSKSPKIVLRSPKVKSTKSKARVSASKVKRSSIPKRFTQVPSKRSTSPDSSLPLKSYDSPKKWIVSHSPRKGGEPSSLRRSGKHARTSLDSPASLMSIHLARVDSPNSSREFKLSGPMSMSRIFNVRSPTVILNKISSLSTEMLETVTTSSLQRTPLDYLLESTLLKSSDAAKQLSRGGKSPHRGISNGMKGASITDSGMPLRQIDSPRSSAAVKLATGKSLIPSSRNTSVDSARKQTGSGTVGSMLSSTPRERIRCSANLSLGLGISSVVDKGEVPFGSCTMIFDGRPKRRSFRLEDESNPLIREDELFSSLQGNVCRLDGTYEIGDYRDATITMENDQEKIGSGTYKLAEPKTPNLRRKTVKRSIGDLETSNEESAVKRACRVRFASPTPCKDGNKTIGTVIGQSRSPTPGYRVRLARTSQAHHSPSSVDFEASERNTAEERLRRRSSSMTNVSLLKTPVAGKRRSNSVSQANARSVSRKAQVASFSRLSKPRLSILAPKKPDSKTPVVRKAPNFAQIHQKKFAKMESLVDAKIRVEKRHLAMHNQICTSLSRVKSKAPTKPAVSSQPIAPIVAVNGGYNRYGFKLRKDDAMKIVKQKQSAHTSQKNQNENRLLLKGVRTNRRFDLIMKARNIKL